MSRNAAGTRTTAGSRFLDRDFGTCLSFNGSTSYVAGSGFNVYRTTGYSVEFWVKGNPQNDFRIYSEGSSSTGVPFFNFDPQTTGKITVATRNDANSITSATTTKVVMDGKWHHCVWTDSNGTASFYIDGVPDVTNFNYTPSTVTLNQMAVGCLWRTGTGNFYVGKIDIVRTYTVALSQANVTQLYSTGIVPDRTKLFLEWLMDEGSGNTVSDSSGNARNGDMTGHAATYSTDVFIKARTLAT